ncbi:MAG: hypothetical protein ACTSWI_06605 [Alphaproteobacteria bacterium]
MLTRKPEKETNIGNSNNEENSAAVKATPQLPSREEGSAPGGRRHHVCGRRKNHVDDLDDTVAGDAQLDSAVIATRVAS